MNDLLDQMIKTGFEFIKTANKMMESCRLKKNMRFSNSRLIIAFYLRRAVELSESFLILLKQNRLADCAVLLRSFWEMGINTDFIFTNEKEKELNAIRFILNEFKEKIKLLKNNRTEFEANGMNVDKAIAKINKQYEEMKAFYSKKYKTDDWKWTRRILDRANKSTSWVIKQAYYQVYAYTSKIEHHDMSFGEDYVNANECKPLKNIKTAVLLRPDVNLIMCRSILLVIMKTFNEEFKLHWENKLKTLGNMQDQEYEEMKKRDKVDKKT